MTDRSEPTAEHQLLAEVREDLALQFVRVARAERPKRNRWLAFGALGALALIPASLAAAEILDGDHSIRWDGQVTRVDGEVISCPASTELVAELQFDPCGMVPAPAPENANSLRDSRTDTDSAAREGLQQLDESAR